MNTTFKINPSGSVSLKWRPVGGFFHRWVNVKNAIQPNAIEIVTSRLADLSSSKIDLIQVFNEGVLKSARSIQMTSKVSANAVEFFTTFSDLDFNGDFDEIRLVCSSIGPFAAVTGLTQTKPADEELAITWKIKIV